ncbi:TetR/AcrR family transcriptional regulator [Streptomyces sp. NPDC005438]|uniref:TetR/AcrR family transcriptional regulator n=1 Tax=Streptomyces sp. NPDC005438 TaxID=3156880 RepID=UPI00339FDDB0
MSSPKGPSRRMPPGERRKQILDAARRVLDLKPIDEVSMESVAKEAGVSPGLLFHYFGSQRKFRDTLVRAAAEEVIGKVSPDPTASSAVALRTGIETFIREVAKHPSVYLAVVRLSQRDRGEENLHRRMRKVLADWLLEGLQAADCPLTPAVRLTVQGWLAHMEEMVISWFRDRELSQSELADLCETTFYQAIRVALADDEHYERVREAIQLPRDQEPARVRSLGPTVL